MGRRWFGAVLALLVLTTSGTAVAQTDGSLTLRIALSDNCTPADASDDLFLNGVYYELRSAVSPHELIAEGHSHTPFIEQPDYWNAHAGYVDVVGLAAGDYHLHLTSEGTPPLETPVTIVAGTEEDLGTVYLRADPEDCDGDGYPETEDCDDRDPYWWLGDEGTCLLEGDTECTHGDRYEQQCNPPVTTLEERLQALNVDVNKDKFGWESFETPGGPFSKKKKHLQAIQHFEVDGTQYLAVDMADTQGDDVSSISLVKVEAFGSEGGELDKVESQHVLEGLGETVYVPGATGFDLDEATQALSCTPNETEECGFYDHPGGMQMIGEYLFVALENHPVADVSSHVGVWRVDRKLSAPAEVPEAIFERLIAIHGSEYRALTKHTAVGVTKLRDGTYLMAACVEKSCEEIRFFKTRTSDLSVALDPKVTEWGYVGEWIKAEHEADDPEWQEGGEWWEECEPQNMNVVVDADDGSIYLVTFAGRKTWYPKEGWVCGAGGGKDYLFAYQLSKGGGDDFDFTLEFFPDTNGKKVRVRTGDACDVLVASTGTNFDAGAGLMIRPGGAETLDVIATEHYDSCGTPGKSRWGSTPKWKSPGLVLSEFYAVPEIPDEGEVASIWASMCTPAADGLLHATVDWGDDSDASEAELGGMTCDSAEAGPVPGLWHAYADNGLYEVELCIDDSPGGQACMGATVEVVNVPPVVEAGAGQQVVEGEITFLDPATFQDFGTLDTHTAAIDWGDGTLPDEGLVTEDPFGPPGSPPAWGTVEGQHVYADNGDYTVTVTVVDDDGGMGTDVFTASVDNTTPVVDAGQAQVIYEGDVLELGPATFHDQGTADTHTALLEWGDGSPTEDGQVVESPFGPPGDTAGLDGEVEGSHQYFGPPGHYTATVTVEDDDGAIDSDDLQVTVANGFLRFCVFADHSLAIESDAVVECGEVPGGEPGEKRPSGAGSRGKIKVKKASTVVGEVLSRESTVDVEKDALLEGGNRALGEIKVDKNVGVLGDLTSASDIVLSQGVSVVGDVTAGGVVEMALSSSVSGTVREFADVPPIPAITGLTPNLVAGGPDIVVEADEVLILPPGDYGKVEVKQRGTLVLAAGVYRLEAVDVKRAAFMAFDLAGDVVLVDVVEKMIFGDYAEMFFVSSENDAADVLFRVGGDVDLHRHGNYLGTFLAPWGKLDLLEGARLEGALYGQRIRLSEEVHLIGHPALELIVALHLTP